MELNAAARFAKGFILVGLVRPAKPVAFNFALYKMEKTPLAPSVPKISPIIQEPSAIGSYQPCSRIPCCGQEQTLKYSSRLKFDVKGNVPIFLRR